MDLANRSIKDDDECPTVAPEGPKCPYQFTRSENLQEIVSTLRSRLPQSALVYNLAMMTIDSWSNEYKWYTMNEEDDSLSSWIVVLTTNEGFGGQEISISKPPASKITPKVKSAFSAFEEIDWACRMETTFFNLVATDVSAMLSEISLRDKGKCTEMHPCILYHMDDKKALALDDSPKSNHQGSTAELRDLNCQTGINFLRSTYKYLHGSNDEFIRKLVARNPSSGIFVDNLPVAGAGLSLHGQVGMLYTLKEYRGQGLAKLAMNSVIKKAVCKGFVSTCCVELGNEASKAFQKKLGFVPVDFVDDVVCKRGQYD